MPIFPRPVSPRGALADLWHMLRRAQAHKWPLLGLSVAITYVIVWTFNEQLIEDQTPERYKIMYVDDYGRGLKSSDIIRQQKAELAQMEKDLEGDQRSMQKIADALGIEWREQEAKDRAERLVAIRTINARLDERLARTLALEAKAAQQERPAIRPENAPPNQAPPK